MKPGDIVMVFANPIKIEHPIDQAKLIERIWKFSSLEYWKVEYLNDTGHYYKVLIRNLKYGKSSYINK